MCWHFCFRCCAAFGLALGVGGIGVGISALGLALMLLGMGAFGDGALAVGAVDNSKEVFQTVFA